MLMRKPHERLGDARNISVYDSQLKCFENDAILHVAKILVHIFYGDLAEHSIVNFEVDFLTDFNVSVSKSRKNEPLHFFKKKFQKLSK